MNHDRPVRRVHALGALVLLLALVGAAPAAILSVFGWPLTRGVLRVRRWPDALTGGELSDDAVLRVLVTVVLIVLAYLLACAVDEVVALVRRADRTHRARNPLSRGVRHLVAVAAVLVSTARPAAPLAAPRSPSTPSSLIVPSRPVGGLIGLPDPAVGLSVSASGDLADLRDHPPGTISVEAGRRDTLYSLAVRHLGDGERRDELLRLNRGRVMVDGSTFDGTVRPGYQMLVHAEAGVAAPAAPDARAVASTTYVVQPGDSLWSIAERLLGDGTLHAHIHDANLGREVEPGVAYLSTTTVIRPGWALVVPSIAGIARTHVVARGESVWSIAADELAADGRAAPSASDVASYVERTVEANAERFVHPGHPELVLPGQELTLPTHDAPASSPPPARPAAPVSPLAAEPPVELPSPTVAPSPLPTPTVAAPTESAPTTVTPTESTPTVAPGPLPPPTAVAPTTVGTSAAAPELPPPTSVDASPPGPAASAEADAAHRDLLGLGGAVVLAAGVVAAASKLRHARLNRRRPGHRVVAPPARAVAVERALRAVASGDTELARWGPLALRHLAPRLGAEWDGSFPMVAEVHLDPTGLEVHWTAPRPTVIAPWRIAGDGSRWRLGRGALEPEVLDGVVPPCPGLVTVGRRDRTSLLLDVETAALVSVVGPAEAVASFGRSLVLELAVSDFSDLLDIRLVGLPDDGFEHLRRVHAVASLDQALAWARPVRAGTDELLAERAATSLFELRARQGPTAVTHEPLVLVVSPTVLDPTASAELARLCEPGRGVVAVVLGPVPSARATVTLGADGSAEVERSGVAPARVVAAHVPEMALVGIGVLLGHAGDAEEHAEPIPFAVRHGDDPFDEPAFAVEVRLLGPVAVGPSPGEDWDDVTGRTLELLVWLATRTGPEPARHALADLWPDRGEGAAQSFNHHVAHARARLGSHGGELLVPLPVAERFRVATSVTTDLARLDRRVRWAARAADGAAMVVLRDGLSLVRGRPFTARSGFEWAHADQLVFRAEQLVVDAAHRLAQLALAARDPNAAVWATTAGLRGRPGDELLYQLRMKAFAAMDKPANVRLAMNELCTELQDLAGVDEPSDETAELYEQLMGRGRSA